MTQPVEYAVDGGVATITLSRPDAMNSLDTASKEALLAAVQRAGTDDGVRCLVLTGTGRAFCVGQDLHEHIRLMSTTSLDGVWETVDKHYSPIALSIATMAKPVIAAVNGIAAGAGLSLALACDLRIGSVDARFNTAFTGVALSCDTGLSWTLPRLIGTARSLELLLLPRTVDADEALSLGLLTKVVAAKDLMLEVALLATKLAAGPTLAFASLKQSIAFASTHSLDESLAFESRMMACTGGSADHRNAVQSFVDKEKPTFEGR